MEAVSKGDMIAMGQGGASYTYSSDSYPTRVPYRGEATIRELILSGRYDQVDEDLVRFPDPKERGTYDEWRDIVAVHFRESFVTEEAVRRLAALGLRGATVAELLAFGSQYPHEHSAVALGQRWLCHRGRQGVVFIGLHNGKRCLFVQRWLQYEWSRSIRFLALRENPVAS